MARVDLPTLMMKLTCDKDPKHRHFIVRDHLRLQGQANVEHCFWELVGACPDQIDLIQKYTGEGTPSIPRVKRLMTQYYEYFKTSVYFDEKFLKYECVGEVDPLRRIVEFCRNPRVADRKGILKIYQHVDARVGRILRNSLPPEYLEGWFVGVADPRTAEYEEYDKEAAAFYKMRLAQTLTKWEDKILLHISMGTQRALKWGGYQECAKTFRHTMNSDVKGLHRLLLSFIVPVREVFLADPRVAHTSLLYPVPPRQPFGWYAFSIPKSECAANYARLLEQSREEEEKRRNDKAARKAEREELYRYELRLAEEIKRSRQPQ
jgi:hypothetical protein